MIKNGNKKVVAGGIVLAALGTSLLLNKIFYKVTRVIDGDTFVTAENRYIRFDSVNAPELEYCMGDDSKKYLEKLVLNKKVFLKVNYVDDRKRLVSDVYTLEDGNIGGKMLSAGMATFKDKGMQKNSGLNKIEAQARKEKIGVYSTKCTQEVNPDNPKCNIKANNSVQGRYYHYPSCQSYATTLVQTYLGDKWFCTEKEAIKAGFKKGLDCH